MPKVIEGTHADSGRRMQVIISMDTPDSPSDLIATIQGLGEVELSLLALAEAMAASSTRYGQAMARIIGCPDFRSRFKSAKIEVLAFDHLVQQYPDQQTPIEFEMLHRSKLHPSLCKDDVVHFVGLEGAPYFMGDYKRTHPKGNYELAATVRMRDLVWYNDEYFFAGPEYFWEQYLDHIGTRAEFKARRLETLQRLIYAKFVPEIDASVGEMVRYRFEERAPKIDVLAVKEAARAYTKDEVYVVGPHRWVVSKGMAVVFELPVWATFKGDYLKRLHGNIIGFRRSTDPRHPWNITIRLHLSQENIPHWLLDKVLASQLIQTNLKMTITEAFLVGVYSMWPACLFQGTCTPGFSDTRTHDRVIVGHVQLCRKGDQGRPASALNATEEESDVHVDGSLSSSAFIEEGGKQRMDESADQVLDPLIKLHEGKVDVEVYGLVPVRATDALAILGYQDDLTSQVNLFLTQTFVIALSAHAPFSD
jgi:hypothetical protein